MVSKRPYSVIVHPTGSLKQVTLKPYIHPVIHLKESPYGVKPNKMICFHPIGSAIGHPQSHLIGSFHNCMNSPHWVKQIGWRTQMFLYLSITKKYFCYQGPTVWNALPADLKQCITKFTIETLKIKAKFLYSKSEIWMFLLNVSFDL